MTKSILITGASKGIGRAAAEALAKQGWAVIGVARSSPPSFPGVFIQTDLADRDQTGVLANDLAARKNVLRSEEHTSELQSRRDFVCRLLLEKKKKKLAGRRDHIRVGGVLH